MSRTQTPTPPPPPLWSPQSELLAQQQSSAIDLIVEQKLGGYDAQVLQLDERYAIGKMLGEGRFSQVFKATRTDGSLEVALKSVELEALEDDDMTLEALEAEVKALRLLSRAGEIARHCLQLHEIVRVPGDAIYLALSLVPGCELYEMIDGHGAMPLTMARALVLQLCSALAVLHESVGVCHRDVKPENLMVHGLHSAESATLVLIDFGYAAIGRAGEGLSGVAGSPLYTAPEVLDASSRDTPSEQSEPTDTASMHRHAHRCSTTSMTARCTRRTATRATCGASASPRT